MPVPNIQEIEICDELKKCSVTRLAKAGPTSLILVCKGKPVLFNIQKEGLFATLQNFKDKSKAKIDPQTQEAIILVLSQGEYYPNIIQDGKASRAPYAVTAPPSCPTAGEEEEGKAGKKLIAIPVINSISLLLMEFALIML